MSKVGVGGAGGHDQVIVIKLKAVQLCCAPCEVEAGNLAEQNFDVVMFCKDLANGRCNLSRGQSSRSDLIKQWLKGVVILPVYHRNLDGQPG